MPAPSHRSVSARERSTGRRLTTLNKLRPSTLFAPNSKHRALVTPGKRGKVNTLKASIETEELTTAERQTTMTWAQRLKRVFTIDIETCHACGGAVPTVGALGESDCLH